MLYIWSYLKRYPKWLVLDFVAANLFCNRQSRSANGAGSDD